MYKDALLIEYSKLSDFDLYMRFWIVMELIPLAKKYDLLDLRMYLDDVCQIILSCLTSRGIKIDTHFIDKYLGY